LNVKVFFACLIPLACHSVYRVCYVWGGLFHDKVLDITRNFLTSNVFSTLQQVEHVINQVTKAELRDIDYGVWHKS